MTKKNLSDLLKAEASIQGTDTVAKTAPVEKLVAKATPSRSTSRLTKADLEKQVAQLTADLKASQKQEAALAKQVQGLKADLAKQQEHIFTLKSELEQAQEKATLDAENLQKATEELKETKQVILKMTEAAAQPSAAAKSVEIQKPTEKAAEKPAPTKPALSVKLRQGGDISRNSRRLPSLKAIPDYAIEHGEQRNRMLSNDEIGWVD